jgi:hypothetical protein
MRWKGRARLVAEALGDASPIRIVGSPRLAEVLGRPLADDGEAAALVAVADPTPAELDGWTRAVRDGGRLVLVGRGGREEAMRLALCAGLVDLEQRVVGRSVVTSGRVRRLP